jgi:hypothetical protein
MTPMQCHAVANAVQALEAMVAMCDLTPEEFYAALKEQAQRLRGALKEEEQTS